MSGSFFYAIIPHMKEMIVLMGGQGVGKGTFARKLCEIHEFNHIETGAILRNAAKTDKVIADIITRGDLVPHDTLLKIVANSITDDKDIILDGFPRTLEQAKWLISNYSDKFKIHIIYLEVPKEIMIQRIQKRIREGGGRADDADTSAIQHRLDIFWNTTMPVIEWLRKESKIKFSEVDVQGEVNDNFANILKALRK